MDVFSFETISAWIIGSFVTSPKEANDCDVLVIVSDNQTDRLIKNSKVWRKEFYEEFELPLHLTRLTHGEISESKDFLELVFSRPNIKFV